MANAPSREEQAQMPAPAKALPAPTREGITLAREDDSALRAPRPERVQAWTSTEEFSRVVQRDNSENRWTKYQSDRAASAERQQLQPPPVGTGMGTVGHQRFAMDRSSRSDPNESRGSASSGPPPKASRTEEPPVTGIPMTQLATVSVTNQPERWVYKSGGQTYENDEAWRRYEHDLAAHE